MTHTLTKAVEQFATLTQNISDPQLERAWAWQSYDSEGIRFAFFRTYEELRELAVKLRSERSAQGRPPSAAQLILAQYDAAYWDLQAALCGLEPGQLDRAPAEGEWSLHKVVAHILGGDLGFYVAVRYALEKQRSGDGRPAEITEEAWGALSGLDDAAYDALMAGPFTALQDYHRTLHERVLCEFAGISDAELETPSRYWEKEPMSVRFRLHRFDSHVRQHTIQVDKAIAALGQAPNEAKRLVRLIYAALADVNGALIGAWDMAEESRLELAQTIRARAEEITGCVPAAESSLFGKI
jgi:uncharacterized damage-inducible protein DinB